MPTLSARIIEVCVFSFEGNRPQYLLLHRSRNERIYPGIWQIITGSIEGNETAVEAALRELSEETGLTASAFWVAPHVSTFYDQSHDSVNLCPLFAARVEPGSEPRLSPEHSEYGWYSFEDATRLLVWPGQRQGLHVVDEYIVRGNTIVGLTRIR